jgi:hypothetical protein
MSSSTRQHTPQSTKPRVNPTSPVPSMPSAQACWRKRPPNWAHGWCTTAQTTSSMAGGTQPWVETDATGPLSVYGQTKLEGEQAIQASGCKHLILRTSWVYAARGGNFAKTMLKLAQERERLTVIDDQWGSPTGADLLADVTAHGYPASAATAAGRGPLPLRSGWRDQLACLCQSRHSSKHSA